MNTKPNASTQQQSSHLDATSHRDEIQERAYFRYVDRGRTDGKALDDWLVAETELRQKPGSRGDA